MADLTSKLAGSIQKSMSGFGAGIKGAFMSANPAGFGLAMKGIQSVMASQVSMQKKDFAERQRDRQFVEENANEQRKIDSEKLSTLRSMDNTLKKILDELKKAKDNAEPSKSTAKKILGGLTPDKNTLGQVAAGAAAASVYKAAKQWEDFFSGLLNAIKGLINGLKSIFSGDGALANLIKRINDLFKEEGALGSLFKKFKDLFAEEGALGRLFKKFKDLFAEEGALGSVFKKFKDLFAEEGALGSVFKKFKDLFAEEGALGSLFKKFKDLFAEEGALGSLFKKFKDLFAEEGALGSVFKKFKNLFAEEGALGSLFKKFKDLFAEEGALGSVFKKFKDLFAEEGALGSVFKKFKNLFAEEGALGSLFKKFKNLFAEEGALGSLFKKFKNLFAEEGALGSVINKFKDLFAEEGAFGSIIKKFKDLFSEESALGKGIQKLKALFAEEGALGSVIKKFKDLFTEEGVFGKMIKGFSDLFTEEGALGKGIQKLKALFAEEGVFGKMIKGVGELFTEAGFFGIAMQKFKDLFSAESTLGKLFTKIGTLADDAVSLLKGVGPLAEKFPILGTFFKGAFAIFERALKIIPGLNIIFFAIDGLFAAFDTEQIRKNLGVQEVTLKERVAAFFGGGAGGFLGGIIDASLWLVDKIFGTTFAEKSTKEGGDGTYQEKFTKFFTKVVNEFFTWFTTAISVPFNLIKGIFTGNFDDFKKSFDDLMLIYQDWAIIVLNAFGALGVGIQNMFGRFINFVQNKLKSSETIGIIYDSVSGAITAIQNSVGRLFYDLGGIVENAMYSAKSKMAELSEKYLGIKINVDKPAARAAYVEYKAQKFSENYKPTAYVDKIYTPIKNVAGEKRLAVQAEKNATYKENESETKRMASRAAAANPPKTVSAADVAGSTTLGSSGGEYKTNSANPNGAGATSTAGDDVPAIRNNNPGNLRYYAKYSQTPSGVTYGAAPGPEGSFAVFPTKEAGLAAMRKQIVIDTQNKGMTLAQFITKYAPPGDNNPTAAYINNMASAIGIGPNDRIPANKIDQLQAAMILQEGGSKSASYYGTPSTNTLQASVQNNSNQYRQNVPLATSGVVSAADISGSNVLGSAYTGADGYSYNSSAAPTGTPLNPVIVETAVSSTEKELEQKVNEAIIASQPGTQEKPIYTVAATGVSGDVNYYGNEHLSRSNVNDPTDTPTGTESDPIIVAQGAADPAQKAQQVLNDAAIQQQPVISQAQLDEMKKQQLYREKVDAENKRYQNERDNLEKQFRATLENNYRNQLTAAIPMGVTGAAATTNAGANIANKYLAGPMNELATKLFGKEAGGGVGQIFTQLAGSYGNQLVGSVLAPMLGMSGDQMNRSLNNFAAGNEGMGWSDLLYGMTGISTDLRTGLGYEDGINSFSKNLADITATPFSPLFKMGSTSGASPEEIAATNAGIIAQNAATQNAQIQIAAGTAFGKSVVGSAGDFGRAIVNGGGQGGTSGSGGGGILGAIVGTLTGGGTNTGGGGGTDTTYFNSVTGKFEPHGTTYSSNGNDSFMGRLGNMLTGGKGGAKAGVNFLSNLGGKFIGNALGVNTNSFSGVYAQTGINATLQSLLTSGGPGLETVLARLGPAALMQRGVMSLGNMIGGASGTFLGDVGLGMSAPGLGAYGNMAETFSMTGPGATGMQLGSVLGAAGTAYGAVSLSDALSGGYKLDPGLRDVHTAAVAIGSLFAGPAGGFIAGAIGAAVNRMFGHGAPELRGMGIQGTLGASKGAGGSGTTLEGWKNIFEAGGTYTSDRNTRSTFGISPDIAEAIMKDVDSQLKNMKEATTVLGLTSNKKFEDFTQSIVLDFQNKSVQEQEKMLTDTLKTFNNGMLNSVFPVFESFTEAGEDSTDAMNRLANVTSTFDAGWKMLGYSSIFNPGTTGGSASNLYGEMVAYGVNQAVGQPLMDTFGGLNVDSLRAAKIASDPAFADSYYNMKQVQTNVGATRHVGGGMYGGGHDVAADPIYAMVRDGINAEQAKNNDLLLAATFKQTVLTSFGAGDLEKGKTAFASAGQAYFNKYYSAKEQRDIALKAAKDKITEIETETGATGLSGTDVNTKYQEKLDNYRTQVEAAKAAMLADPTNQTKIDRYTALMNNADSYAQSVQNIIGLSKAIANPQDAAAKNANLQASLDALANKAILTNGVVSAASTAGYDVLGASSLGGYQYTAARPVSAAGTVINGVTTQQGNGTVISGVSGTSGDTTAGGTLFAPTTYVDNTSNSTNVNGASGSDNVRDTYSHPILGSTERSVSSTYNYNYLYR